MTNPTASDIEKAIFAALTAGGFPPTDITFAPAADDSAALGFDITSADKRKVSVAVVIPKPIPPQKELAPGWGLSFFGNDDTASINKNCAGGPCLKRYYWSQLESTEGVYTLGAIGQAHTPLDDIEQTRLWNLANPTKKRQMIFMIMDKSLIHGNPPSLPVYLRAESWSDPVFSSGATVKGYEWPIVSNMGPGTCSLRWVPRVVARMNALTAYIASQLDGSDEFCGVAFMETAIGFDPASLTRFGYSVQHEVDAYVSMLTAASTAFVQSKVFWTFNFLTGGEARLLDIAKAVAALPNKNVYAGGPDLLPDDYSLSRPGFAYSMYPQMAAMGIKMFIQLSPPGYSLPAWTFQKLHDFAVSQLHVSNILAVPTNGSHLKYSDLVKLIPSLPLTV